MQYVIQSMENVTALLVIMDNFAKRNVLKDSMVMVVSKNATVTHRIQYHVRMILGNVYVKKCGKGLNVKQNVLLECMGQIVH